jgi:hypothetical protein
MELGKVICVPDPDEAAARDEAMAAVVTADLSVAPDLPGIDNGVIHAGSAHAGHLFVQDTVAGRPFDDAHGTGWRLITLESEPAGLDPATDAWFASIGGQIVPLLDPGPAYVRWFAEHEVSWALQRPDFYLYGTATDPRGAAELLGHLRASLTTDAATTGASS